MEPSPSLIETVIWFYVLDEADRDLVDITGIDACRQCNRTHDRGILCDRRCVQGYNNLIDLTEHGFRTIDRNRLLIHFDTVDRKSFRNISGDLNRDRNRLVR